MQFWQVMAWCTIHICRDHPSLLYTWGPSIPIVHMGTIHPYCTHGDHPSLLYTWGPSILLYCTHWDHPSLLHTWGPSIPIDTWEPLYLLYTWEPSNPIVHTCRPSMLLMFWGHDSTMGKWWCLYCHFFSIPP